MRNGIYRVWIEGPKTRSSGAVVLRDGDLIACNPAFGFFGRYRVIRGQFSATVACRRVNRDSPAVNLPELDAFELMLEGRARRESAHVTGTITEMPGFALPFEFVWLCEA
jgi:hypothetical protein